MYAEPAAWARLMNELVTVQADYLLRQAEAGARVVNFSTGTFPYREEVAAYGGDVIGVDFRMPLSAAWQKIDYDLAI